MDWVFCLYLTWLHGLFPGIILWGFPPTSKTEISLLPSLFSVGSNTYQSVGNTYQTSKCSSNFAYRFATVLYMFSKCGPFQNCGPFSTCCYKSPVWMCIPTRSNCELTVKGLDDLFLSFSLVSCPTSSGFSNSRKVYSPKVYKPHENSAVFASLVTVPVC